MIFDGDHPERGRLVQPKEYEAHEKVCQKLRSMKKVLLAGPPSDKQVAWKEKRQCAVLYPRGAAFNELRRGQVFLGNLLKDILQDYYELPPCCQVKHSFVKQRVFDQLKAIGYVFMIFNGDHPERGRLVQPKEHEAYEKVCQKLRSMKKVARKEKILEKEVCQKLLSMKKMRLVGPPPEQATRKEERFENIVQEGTSYPGFASDQSLFRPTLPAAFDAFNRFDLMPPLGFTHGQNLFRPTLPAAFDAFKRIDLMLSPVFASGQNLFWPTVPAAFDAFNPVDLMLPTGFTPGQNLFQRGLADNNKPGPTFAVPSKPHPIPIVPKPSHQVQNHQSTHRYHHRQGQGQSRLSSYVNKPDPTVAVPPKPHPRQSQRVQNHYSTYRYHHRQGQGWSSQPPQIPLL